ncbi:MAG: ORF6C domain-containing protein [Campylobacterales bacterium]|nr:ORF6C domain-containing protein [Campylobacterales bacterium]
MTSQNGNGNVSIDGDSNSVNVTNNITNNYPTTERKIIKTKAVVVGEYDKNIHLSQGQQSKLKDLVVEIVGLEKIISPNMTQNEIYSRLWSSLNRHCQATSYKLIEQINYSKAVRYLQKLRTIKRKDIKNKNGKRFKELTIKSILGRWSYFGNKAELFMFASQKLEKQVIDLEKLTVNDLDTLYDKIFAKKISKDGE